MIKHELLITLKPELFKKIGCIKVMGNIKNISLPDEIS
jgi:hypothetical protein